MDGFVKKKLLGVLKLFA